MCKTRILLTCLLFLAVTMYLPFSVRAGQTWLTWNERAGLPGNNLSCLAIKKGMMVVGSDKGPGLFCENHSSWFKLADYSEIMQNLPIRAMDFDSYGVLWAATPHGVISIDLENFPERNPEIRVFATDHGLPTIDIEALQIHENRLFVGCFGGWLASAEIQPGSGLSSFKLENDGALERDDSNKILSVGITAMAMDFPEGGIYATKGSGLLKTGSHESAIQGSLPSDWVDDFLAYNDGRYNKIIAITQSKLNLINDSRLVGEVTLPKSDCWMSCLAVAPSRPDDGYKKPKVPGYLQLETHLGKQRTLYIGTRGQGIWMFSNGRWSNFTARDSPLPSNNINKIYYLHGADKLAILSDAGLTMLGIDEEMQFDAFEKSGSAPYYSSTIWPFMSRWGPYVYGYPYQFSYPIINFIAYGRICRGKDLWIAHAKGISRYVFPSTPFLGAMQLQYHLSGRFENPLNNPSTNTQIEDSTIVNDQPPAVAGENIWHHYCVEPPTDECAAPLDKIWVTLDLKFMVGPDDLQTEFKAESGQQIKKIDVAKASGTPVIIQGDERFNKLGQKLYQISSLYQDCPIHQIPSANVNDMALDLSERPFVILDDNRLTCLDSPVSETVPDPSQNWWYVFEPGQLPWEKFEELYLISVVNADLFVGGKRSGLFFLPAAHAYAGDSVRAEDWQRIELPQSMDNPEAFSKVIALTRWENCDGEFLAVLHSEGLSLFDGGSLRQVDVPKRAYTAMVSDRQNNLWLGSENGLICVSPDLEPKEIIDGEFNSKHVVHLAAAPDNARYPFTIAAVVDGRAHLLEYSDPVPNLTRNAKADSRHRLKVKNTEVFGGGQILLFDGRKWEALPRPGVISIAFDQSFLWVSTACRVIRLYLPILVQSY